MHFCTSKIARTRTFDTAPDGVTVDFLLDEEEVASYDKETVERIQSIQKMEESTCSMLFNVIEPIFRVLKQSKRLPPND